MMWTRCENAVGFFAEVALLGIERWRAAFKDEIHDVVLQRLNWNRSRALPDVSWEARDAADKQYRLFRERWGDGTKIRAVFKLVDGVAMAWHNPERRMNTMRGQVRVAKLDMDAVEKMEIAHRIVDLDPDGRLGENDRLAFEAAWLGGHRKFAVKLLELRLKDLAA